MRLITRLLFIIMIVVFFCSKNNNENKTSPSIEVPKQLSNTNQDYRCFWSPDGKLISFLTARNTYDPNIPQISMELWIMDKDGENQRELINQNDIYSDADIHNVSWSNNSQEMIFQIVAFSGNIKSEIWKVNLEGDKQKMSSDGDFAQQPCFSPDGSKISYIIQELNPEGSRTLYKLYVADSELFNSVLIETGIFNGYSWTPESDALIYSLYDTLSQNYDLWQCSTDGSTKTRLTETSDDEGNVYFSSNGQSIAYTLGYYDKDLYYSNRENINPILIKQNIMHLTEWVAGKNNLVILTEEISDGSYWSEAKIIDLQGNIVESQNEGKVSYMHFSAQGDYYVYTDDYNIWLDYFN